MNNSIRSKPFYRIIIWSAFFVCILSIFFIVSRMGSLIIPFGDSIQYWAAGKLMLNGGNPYSAEQVSELKQQVGTYHEFPPNAPSMMLYPPWAIPFMLPFGIFSFPISRLMWLIFHIIIILICINLIWRIYRGSPKLKYLAYLISIGFAPTIFVLVIGHFTTLPLLGLVGFLFFIQNTHRNRWSEVAAGFCAAIVLIKPQLLYLFLFALLLWTLEKRKWSVIIGGIGFILIFSLISMIFNPIVISQYWETLSKYSMGAWATPTIGMGLRTIFRIEMVWLLFVPSVIGVIWYLFLWRKDRKSWDWVEQLPLIILVSYVTSPFMWTYDMVVLLLPVLAVTIAIFKTRNRWLIGVFLTIYFLTNIFTVVIHRQYEDSWFIWFAPFILIWYLLGKRISYVNK